MASDPNGGVGGWCPCYKYILIHTILRNAGGRRNNMPGDLAADMSGCLLTPAVWTCCSASTCI